MSPRMGGFWLLVAIGCSLIPCVTPCMPREYISFCKQSLPFLPEELASLVKYMSYDATVALANRDSNDNGRNMALFCNRVETLKMKSVGLLSTKTVDHLKDLLWNTAFAEIIELPASRKMQRHSEDNTEHIYKGRNDYCNLMLQGEMNCSVIQNIHYMAMSIGSCLFINITGDPTRHCLLTVQDWDLDIDIYNKIRGTPRVRGIVFHPDQPLKIGSVFEDVDTERINNYGTRPITLQRTYTERHGHTKFVTRAAHFSASVSAGLNFGFSYTAVQTDTLFSFESSTYTSTTFTGDTMKATSAEKWYTFTVLAGESAMISVKQQQLSLRLNYTVELDFNGFRKNMTGIWEGTANSNIEVSYIPLK